jgi:hypothetical protein
MISMAVLKHIAGGILGSFVSRNNDVGGYWALGILYADATDSNDVVRLSLLEPSAIPPTPNVQLVAENYAEFLHRALIRKGVAREDLAEVNVEVQFNAAEELGSGRYFYSSGEIFVCTVTIKSKLEQVASMKTLGRCRKYVPGAFAQRGCAVWSEGSNLAGLQLGLS